jgi:hypothetical protein
MDFGVVDIARCLGQETQTFHCKVRSNPRRNTSNNGVRSWSSTHFEQLVKFEVIRGGILRTTGISILSEPCDEG